MSDDILERIDDTLTFYSSGLGEEITVQRETDNNISEALDLFSGLVRNRTIGPGTDQQYFTNLHIEELVNRFVFEDYGQIELGVFNSIRGHELTLRFTPTDSAISLLFGDTLGPLLIDSRKRRRRSRLRRMRHLYRLRRRGW